MAAHASVWTERFERAEALFDRLIGSLRDVGAAGSLVYPLAARSHLDFRIGPLAGGARRRRRVGAARPRDGAGVAARPRPRRARGGRGGARARGGRTRARERERRAVPGPGRARDRDLRLPGRSCLLELGLGNLDAARDHGLAAERAFGETEGDEPGVVRYAPDLIEALWRLGEADEVPAADRRARPPGRPAAALLDAGGRRAPARPDGERRRGRRALRARARAARADAPAVRDRPHAAAARRAPAASQAPRRRARPAQRRAQHLRAPRRRPLDRAHALGAARHGRPDRLRRPRDRHRRADRPGAPDRPPGRPGPHQPRGRRRALPEREDDRVPPRLDLPQARDPPPRRAAGVLAT